MRSFPSQIPLPRSHQLLATKIDQIKNVVYIFDVPFENSSLLYHNFGVNKIIVNQRVKFEAGRKALLIPD